MHRKRLGSYSNGQRSRRLALETLESRRVMASLPYGAMEQDTAEFMLGKVAVTPVFLESNGQQDASTENWTPSLIQSTLQTVRTGVNWWVDLLAAQQSVHSLEFIIDPTYATTPVPTRYEPISRVSNDFDLWTEEFLQGAGFNNSSNIETNMRAFNNAQRQKLGTDWAYTIFVVNSNNDLDGQFAPGSSFPRAFAFAGGLFLISPSTRPASTFTHETGHIFWAKDEYAGGASSGERRGYYNTQNTNAADNPTPGFVQQPSIMAAGNLLQNAYDNHISPSSTLAMIGWQDSDRDGIFDVLDVPLELTGTGYYDTASSAYKFRGLAKVGLLPNMNSDGLRNDISINRISSIQYRVDGGSWTTLSQPNVYEASLDLSIPLAQAGQVIEIRAVEAKTGITSNVFQGRFQRADAVTAAGINGFVWIDANRNGLRDVNEFGDAAWTVDVLASNGQTLNLRQIVEPDNLPDGVLTATSVAGISITTIGNDSDGRAAVFADSVTSTGAKNFRGYSRSAQSWLSTWNTTSRRMEVDFATATSVVEIDAIGSGAVSFGRLEAFDVNGKLIDRFTTPKLANGQVVKMRVESAASAIAYVQVGAHAGSSVRLDNLRYGPETTTTTQAKGQFTLANLPTGNYLVKVTPSTGSYIASTNGGNRVATSVTAGSVTNDVDFAFTSSVSIWQNPQNRYDVNNNQQVTPLDVLLIINEINQNGSRDLAEVNFQSPPYIDVSGDGNCSALDALLVINRINSGASGEAGGLANVVNATQLVAASAASDSLSDGTPNGAKPEGELAPSVERYGFPGQLRLASSFSRSLERELLLPAHDRALLATLDDSAAQSFGLPLLPTRLAMGQAGGLSTDGAELKKTAADGFERIGALL